MYKENTVCINIFSYKQIILIAAILCKKIKHILAHLTEILEVVEYANV